MKLKKRHVIVLLAVLIALGIGAFSLFKRRGSVGLTPEDIAKELLEFDQNGDGQLSKDELSERMQGLITRGDANQDGVLTRDELRKLAESDAAARQASTDRR